MIPSIGRRVIVLGVKSNGTNEQPAVITRVHDPVDTRARPAMVNLTVFPDCGDPQVRGSVMLYENREEAAAAKVGASVVAFWPPRLPDPIDPRAAGAALALAA